MKKEIVIGISTVIGEMHVLLEDADNKIESLTRYAQKLEKSLGEIFPCVAVDCEERAKLIIEQTKSSKPWWLR